MLTSFDSIPARDRVLVALDCDMSPALDLAEALQGEGGADRVGKYRVPMACGLTGRKRCTG